MMWLIIIINNYKVVLLECIYCLLLQITQEDAKH
jgi:hypothetical protein